MSDTNDASMPMHSGRPFYGYDVDAIQNQYAQRGAESTVGFFLEHLKPGMKVLDCGCGPGDLSRRIWRG